MGGHIEMKKAASGRPGRRSRADAANVRRLLAALRPEAKGAEGKEEAAASGLGDLTAADWKNFLFLARGTGLGPLLSYRSTQSGSMAEAP